jgi:hypothetical protein
VSDVSKFDGLAALSQERFGKPVPALSVGELTALYRERDIMAPGPPDLRIVRDEPPKNDAPS